MKRFAGRPCAATMAETASGGIGLAVRRLAIGLVPGVLLAIAGLPATAETIVTDLPLEDGGIQRVLYVAPARPHAALIMLPGGNGMVEIADDGAIRRMGGGTEPPLTARLN
jgi:hypothetical protein